MDFTELNKWHDCDMPEEFSKLTKVQQQTICNWIQKNFVRRKTPNYSYNSYSLKRYFEESSSGFLLTNGAFKGAMAACGYKAYNQTHKNCSYCISNKSPVFANK